MDFQKMDYVYLSDKNLSKIVPLKKETPYCTIIMPFRLKDIAV
jgi:hypothetical protein